MKILYILTALLLGISLITNSGKTAKALKIAIRRFLKILPSFIGMLVLLAVILYLIPEERVASLLNNGNKWIAMAGALGLGSISIMPGFVAFPLCGILLEQGALYMVLSGFSSTLMMVGIVTFPLEKSYLGTKLALFRNLIGFAIAIAVAIATGLLFGELR